MHRSGLGPFAQPVGAADGLATLDSTTGDVGTTDLRPVVTAGVLVDPGSPSEFTPDQHGDVVDHAPFFEVAEQRTDSLVDPGSVVPDQPLVVAVAVPAAKRQGHAADAHLDQPPSPQDQRVVGGRTVVLVGVRLAVTVFLADLGSFLPDVQRVDQLAGGQHVEGLLLVRVDRGQLAAGINVATQPVDALEQRLPITQPVGGHTVELHVGQAGTVGNERSVGRAQETGRAGVPPHTVGLHADVGRNAAVGRTLQLVQHAAHRRVPADRTHLGVTESGHALERVVTTLAADHRPQHRGLVHRLGDLRETLADLDAWNIRRDRLERTADVLGGLGLDLPHVLVRRTATQEDVDHRLVVHLRLAGRVGPQQIGLVQAKGSHAQGTDLEHATTGDAVAVPGTSIVLLRPEDRQHGSTPTVFLIQNSTFLCDRHSPSQLEAEFSS